MSKYTFRQFQAEYPDDETCLDAIMKVQFGGTEFSCRGCGVDSKFHRITKRRAYACQHCGHHIYPCVGTIFEKSRTNLTKWFHAMYLMTSTRSGVAAKELQRQLGVTYKCAWRMADELRKLMQAADYQGPLGGHVEIDETLVGGKADGHANKMANKTMVMGMVERDGNLRAAPIPNARAATLADVIERHIEPGTTISTDDWRGYNILQVSPYGHGTVNHSAKEYVRGIHHTNSIEGFWSHFKRAIKGTHVHISAKHAAKYVGEFAYRRNMRDSQHAMFKRLVASFALPRLVAP